MWQLKNYTILTIYLRTEFHIERFRKNPNTAYTASMFLIVKLLTRFNAECAPYESLSQIT